MYHGLVESIRVGLHVLGLGCMYQEYVICIRSLLHVSGFESACIRRRLHVSGLGCMYQGWVACIRLGLHVSGLGSMYLG